MGTKLSFEHRQGDKIVSRRQSVTSASADCTQRTLLSSVTLNCTSATLHCREPGHNVLSYVVLCTSATVECRWTTSDVVHTLTKVFSLAATGTCALVLGRLRLCNADQNPSLRIKLFTKWKKNVLLQGPDRQGSPVDPALTQRPVTPAPPEWSSYDAPINFTWVACLSFLVHHHLFITHTTAKGQPGENPCQ